jgi:ribokinase
MAKSIVVVGSLNMDFVVQVASLPVRGQTVSGRAFKMLPGGKGANQACAVGRLSGRGLMVGRVGDDVFGETLKASLAAAGVDVSHVLATPGEATGVALIPVEDGGENLIVVAGGANGRLGPEDVDRALRDVSEGLLLAQLESPIETVEAALRLARDRGMTTILDPAPARPLERALLQTVDVLTPNESEAMVLLGLQQGTVAVAEAAGIARRLLALGPRSVILKLGDKGAWIEGAAGSGGFPVRRVEAVDATAAGDTFNGALAVALAEGRSMPEAIGFANGAASISVTRLGAQASIPDRAEVDTLLAGLAKALGQNEEA